MKTEDTPTAPVDAVVRQSAEVFLERSTMLNLRLHVSEIKGGGWKWSVRNPASSFRLAEDGGQCDTQAEAKLAAHRAAVKLMRRESERLDAEVDFVEESEPEWD